MAELTYNERIHNALIRHQIGLLGLSVKLRNEIWKLLDATEADIRHQIEDGLRHIVGKQITPERLKRVERLIAALRLTRVKAWRAVNEKWSTDLRDLAVAEAGFTAGIIQSHIPVELGIQLPEVSRLKAIATSKPFLGATLSEWAGGIQDSDIARISQQIKIGLTQGETIAQITRRVVGTIRKKGADGTTAVTRRHAESITRTATNAIAAESRQELYHDNADLLSELVFAATLDSNTTPICRSLDGRTFPVDEAPVLPLHWGERSLLLPVVDGEVIGDRPFRAFTEQQLLREYAEREGIKAPKTRKGLPRGSKGDYDAFARKRMRELTGRVPARTSYDEWLRSQPAQFQNEILESKARGQAFRQGATLDKFVTPQGRLLTLNELQADDIISINALGAPVTKFTLQAMQELSSTPPPPPRVTKKTSKKKGKRS